MKKKILFRLLAGVLSVCTLVSVGCKPSEDSSSSSEYEYVPEQPEETVELEKTGVNLIEDHKTEYKVVVPEGKDSVSTFAASEFTAFMALATGVTFEVIEDTGLVYDADMKYVSIGETTLLKGAGISVSSEELGESGYKLKTVGNTLFVASVTAPTYSGAVYGVYDVLHYSIGFKVFAEDEIVYEKTGTVPLYAFDMSYRPSIDIREMGYKAINSDRTLSYRMYSIGKNSDVWSSFTHTLISDYLPYSTYGASHPEWYVNGGQQLCLSNEEMLEELCVQVERKLVTYSETTHVMLGHEDNSSVCTCEDCMATAAKYGGEYSGVELEFSNKVAEKVNKWLETNYPERDVKYVFFAYGPTINPPVTYDEATDTFTSNCENVYIHEDVGVMLAPIAMDFSKSPDEGENKAQYLALRGWSDLFDGKNMYVWHYSLFPYSYMFNYNNFGVIKEYYQFYADIGVKYIFDQGNYDSHICTLEDMRLYVQTQLMWDASQDYETLAYKFIDQYYGLAAPKIKEYYDFIRAHYAKLEEENQISGAIFFMMDDKNLWPIGTVRTLLSIFDDALEALEPLKTADPERYETLYERVQKDRLSPLYMMLQYYIDQLADDVKASYIGDFETYSKMFEINFSREGSYDVPSLIEQWKKM